MTISEALAGVPLQSVLPPALAQTRIHGLDYDSRRVAPGFLFFAFPGSRADGREFAGQASARGAIAIVSESAAPPEASAPWIQVEHGRHALAVASKNFYGGIDERIPLVGITGTNGKTTTSYLVDSILRAAGMTTMLAGTIEYHLGPKILPAPNTTPESLDLHRMLAELDALDNGSGTKAATMEVSSHALALGRVYGLQFHTAVFTNLTQDHLDFHRTMEDYFAAKRLLFIGSGGPPPRYSVLNRDDDWSKKLGTPPPEGTEVLWYGFGPEAMVRPRHIRSSLGGLHFD